MGDFLQFAGMILGGLGALLALAAGGIPAVLGGIVFLSGTVLFGTGSIIVSINNLHETVKKQRQVDPG